MSHRIYTLFIAIVHKRLVVNALLDNQVPVLHQNPRLIATKAISLSAPLGAADGADDTDDSVCMRLRLYPQVGSRYNNPVGGRYRTVSSRLLAPQIEAVTQQTGTLALAGSKTGTCKRHKYRDSTLGRQVTYRVQRTLNAVNRCTDMKRQVSGRAPENR